MQAVVAPQPDGAEELALVERPVPRPGRGEVLVRVAAAGVNRPDVAQRLGNYPPPPGAPTIPGLEIAGEVVAAGAARWVAVTAFTGFIGYGVAALVRGEASCGCFGAPAIAPGAGSAGPTSGR